MNIKGEHSMPRIMEVRFIALSELLTAFEEEYGYDSTPIMDAISDGDATYGSNAFSLVAPGYLVETVKDRYECEDDTLCEDWETVINKTIGDCQTTNLMINLEG
jgi:predicted SnoaL-like aldol condensation-catalyzing enzyme